MSNNHLIPPGFTDNVSFDAYVEHEYKNSIINFFKINGFDLVKAPILEYANNEEKNNFLILSKKNEDLLKIRNDITPQIARIVSSRLINKKRPLKLCYYGEVVRKKGTMLRPERQFLQVGAEIIGSDNIYADIEIIKLAYSALNKIGINEINIDLSSKIFLQNFIKKMNKIMNYNELLEAIKIKDINYSLSILENDKDKEHLYNIFSCNGNFKKINSNLDKLLKDEKQKKEIYKIRQLVKYLESFNINKINLDLLETEETNDKNYYDGIKFTFFAKDVRGEVASGGRYSIINNGKSETATGFTCYMDTVLRASSFKNSAKKILAPFDISKELKNKLTNDGYVIFSIFEESSDIVSDAKKYGCSYYLEKSKILKI